MKNTATSSFLCVSCDCRWGFGEYVEISMCDRCFENYIPKPPSNRGKYEANDHQEAISKVYARLKERSDLRLAYRLKVF